MLVLLIGGPNDGERLDASGSPPRIFTLERWKLDDDDQKIYECQHIYHQENLSINGEVLEFYRHHDLELIDACKTLLNNYNAPLQEDKSCSRKRCTGRITI